MDYSQVIQEALQQQQANPALQASPPAIETGAPLVDETLLKQALARALQPRFAPQPEDVNVMMGKIGQALMQPRMPGESVAGNFGKAMGGGQEFLQQREQQQREQAMQQAQLVNTIASADQVRRNTEMNMKIMATKFPVEFARMQQDLRTATANGDVATKNGIEAKLALANGGEMLVREMQAKINKTEAETGKTRAETAKTAAEGEQLVPAHARYWGAMADYLNAGKPNANANTRQVLKTEDLQDGRRLTTFKLGDQVYHEIFTPGIADPKLALDMAKRQLKVEKPSSWGGIVGGATDAEIQTRAKELMQPKSVTVDITGRVVSAPTGEAPASTSPTDTGKPGPATDVNVETESEAEKLAKSRMGKGETIRVSAPTAKKGAPAFVRDASGNVVPAEAAKAVTPSMETPKPAEDVLPEERGRIAENKQIQGILKPGSMPDVAQVRELLTKAKHNANELLILETAKDMPELTAVERAKITAALKRGRIIK